MRVTRCGKQTSAMRVCNFGRSDSVDHTWWSRRW